jgi:hypothetical protein
VKKNIIKGTKMRIEYSPRPKKLTLTAPATTATQKYGNPTISTPYLSTPKVVVRPPRQRAKIVSA